MTKAIQQGQYVIVRDESGKLMTRVLGDVTSKSTPRTLLRKMTNNGADLYMRLYDIAMGKAHVVQMSDGLMLEPQVPTLEVQRAASKDLLEFLHGKAVAQTEVKEAEQQAQVMEQIQALSDEELFERARALMQEGAVEAEVIKVEEVGYCLPIEPEDDE